MVRLLAARLALCLRGAQAWSAVLPADCVATPLGCLKDGPARLLPFCVGTPGSGPNADCGLTCDKPPGVDKPPADPPCDTSKMTPQYCSAICWAFMSESTGYKGVAFAGAQAGTQCWCGLELPSPPPLAPGCMLPCPGDGTQMCGGLYLSTLVKVDCRSRWGWSFVALVLVVAAGYLGTGAAFRHRQGAKGTDLLPHRQFWTEARALVADGVGFARGGRGGRGGAGGVGGAYIAVAEHEERESRGEQRSPKKKQGAGKDQRSKDKKEGRSKDNRRSKEGSTEPVVSGGDVRRSEPAPTSATAATPEGNTAAGGGGRWVLQPG